MINNVLLQVIQKAAEDEVPKLNLASRGLISLPSEIEKLTNLRELNLTGNHLTSLPTEIGKLTKLSRLILDNNRLSILPSEIVQLTNLQELYFISNQLTSLPPQVFQLNNLVLLDLSLNQLTNLPTQIGQLTNLRELRLTANQLASLPSEVAKLTNLTVLDLSSNQLTNLPAEIVNLSQLETLNLHNNRLTNVPIEITKLTNLSKLRLSQNYLLSLPQALGNLTSLVSLELSSNKLSSLPPDIGQLCKLCKLDLKNNQLLGLPKEVGNLKLTMLYLAYNPLSTLPPEIQKSTGIEILSFYRQQIEQNIDYLYEAKLLIVGEPGAGKTTLAKKIQDLDYQLQQDEVSTEGIDVYSWNFLLENSKEFRVNIWDFGGQEIYHATHQFFLTKRSLYLVVADTRTENTDFYYWLSVVELLSESSPLIIIKNEKQERKREINERQLRSEFINLKETLASNFATNRGLSEILKTIKHYIQNLPHVGTALPKAWSKVREILEQDVRNYISLDEYFQICQDNGFTRREDSLQLSSYLHDLGVCLHFQEDDLLMKTVILKPTWGTDAVYKVLDNPQVIQNLGKFTRNDLANIWYEDKYISMCPELLRLMMNFKLCYGIPSCSGVYIAPQLLSPNQPEYHWDDTENLFLRYKYEFMPKGILTRFIVEIHLWIEQQTCVWRSGVVLNKDGARAEVIELYHKGEIRIRVTGKRKRDLLTTVRYELDKIHASYDRLNYSTLVPCNCISCKSSQAPHFYPLERLYKFLDDSRDIQCPNSYDMVNVRSLMDDVTPEVSPRLTDSQRRRLEDQRNALQAQWDVLSKKSKQLRESLASETSTSVKFQLEEQIREAEVKLAEIGKKLDEIEQKLR